METFSLRESKPEPTIRVKPENLKVFAKMFPSSASEYSKTGLIDWQHLEAAMVDAGLSATHSGGSAVTFVKKDDGGAKQQHGGRIVFHKPHPVAKIDPVLLQSMGKRMRKWFGWDRETFATDEEEGVKG